MSKQYFQVLLALSVFLLSGCAGIPEQTFVLEKASYSENPPAIKSIALLSIPNPPHYYLGEGLGLATALFGGIGAAVELSQVSKDAGLYAGFDFSQVAQKYIVGHLMSKGYKVTVVSVDRSGSHGLLNDYGAVLATDADAVLDIAPVMVGFKKKALSGPFAQKVGPHVSLVMKLVSSASGEVIHALSFQYGYDKNPFATSVNIDSPETHQFENVESLKKDVPAAIEQLRYGVDIITRAVAVNLLAPIMKYGASGE